MIEWTELLSLATIVSIFAGVLLGPLGFNDLVNYCWFVSLFLLDRTLNAQTLAASVRNFSAMAMDLIVAFGERW